MVAAAPFGSFDEAFAWLAAHTNYETMATQRYDARAYGLERVERLLDAVGRPDASSRVVHVLGSKGKGTTATAMARILEAAGRRVGLYTSPHLVHARERITVDGAPLDDAAFCDALDRLRAPVEAAHEAGEPCTFFEIQTTAALLGFADAGCDDVVLEAGMGGRLDATTAAHADTRILTNVSLDHTNHLGTTHAAIAAEKAAAFRTGVPVICGEPEATAAGRVVAQTAERVGAPLLVVGRDFAVRAVESHLDRTSGVAVTRFSLSVRGSPPRVLELPMLGAHQAENGALAAVAAAHLGVDDDAVRRGLAATHVPARLSVHSTQPLVLVDGAHNPASFARLAHALSHAVRCRRVHVVVGMAADKDITASLEALRGLQSHIYATTSGQPRAMPPGALAAIAGGVGLHATAVDDPMDALALAQDAAEEDDVVVVTGSLYLCGAVLAG